ncbi:thioredoxin domain-containing protein 11 [Aplochiton taeniatus]
MLRRARQSFQQVLFLMARRPGLLCGAILLSVLFILAVKFTCSRAKNVVAAARPPVRFFSADAPVVDLYMGQLDQVERLRSLAEVSLIFFYAPWCAHSMAARQEVQQVARKLAKQVQFVAVNCWWSQGKCRKQKSFYLYPVIHMFYKKFGPIEYKGPFKAAYVESFVLRVITPLTYLPSQATLKTFLSYHEPGVVGFFQFNSSPQPPGYITYLTSALQALKRDFRGVVRFAVVTSRQVAEAISLRDDETVYLHRRFNSSLIFPRLERNFTSQDICSWVFEHKETILQWLQPPGTKSRLLEQELTKGPALLLFLPHNPLGSSPDPLIMQIADVAMRYHSCNGSHHLSSWSHRDTLQSSQVCCQSLLLPDSRKAFSTTVCELCLGLSRPDTASGAARCSFPLGPPGGSALRSRLKHCCLHPLSNPTSAAPATIACSSFLSSYSPLGLYSACCRSTQHLLNHCPSPPGRGADCPGEPRARPPLSTPPSLTSPSPGAGHHGSSDDGAGGFTGLRCRTNKTLRFYVLDSSLTWPLAVRLGALGNGSAGRQRGPRPLGAGSSGGSSFAAIVHLTDEVHYVLHRSPIATLTQSLEDFIRNFSAPYSPLQRHQVGEGDSGRGGDYGEPARQESRPKPALIAELSTSSFLPSVMDPHKDVLLFYYTQWCGFCSSLNHVIIQMARLLKGNSTVTIARVNVARNDLPWEFMVDHVPSVLLFPRYRKHSSVKFPDDTPITLPNLLRFLLKHSGALQPSERPKRESGQLLRAEFTALQEEVQVLHQACERLSKQLAHLWRDNRRLTFDARGLEDQKVELQQEKQSLEEQHREKSRQLGEAVRRLEELADASESLLSQNTLLRVLLGTLREREEGKQAEEGKEGNEPGLAS